MKFTTAYTFLLLIIFISCTNNTPTDSQNDSSGSADITVSLGPVGSLTKSRNIDLDSLIMKLTADGQRTIVSKSSINGNSQLLVTKTFSRLASQKMWTCLVITKDKNGVIIHSGTSSFEVRPSDTSEVKINLAANYSMIKANFFPIPDSINECKLWIDDSLVANKKFDKDNLHSDTISLEFDYITSNQSGIFHSIRMEALGIVWGGKNDVIFRGDTFLDIVSGQNSTHLIRLKYVAPKPPRGAAELIVAIGTIGNIRLVGLLENKYKIKPVIWGWGDNTYGQLGDNTYTTRQIPIPVLNETGSDFLTGIRAITAGTLSTYAIKYDGKVLAWGANYSGFLGDGTTIQRNLPVQIPNLTNIIAIETEIALRKDGTVWTWGGNFSGANGDGTKVDRLSPVQVVGPNGIGYLQNVKAISAKTNHALVVKNDGTVWAWGANYMGGELGINSYIHDSPTPVQVHGPNDQGFLENIISVTVGYYHSLALRSDGTVWAWGDNGGGLLGDNTTTNRRFPVQVHGSDKGGYLQNVKKIVSYGSCFALKNDGTVWAWGPNNFGQLGDNTTIERHAPVQVVGPGGVGYLTDVKDIATGWLHTVVLKNDGTVWSWGYNSYGEIGNNTTTPQPTPVQVLRPDGKGPLTNVKSISSGQDHVIITF